jgi:antitoxin (DNA-binding transcriptional repressor) of toxin-antitoxin stability system
VGVVLRAAGEIAPDAVRHVSVTLTENGVPVARFTAVRSDIREWRSERLTAKQLVFLSRLDTDVCENLDVFKRNRQYVKYGLLPSIETFLNDPSGFFKARIGLQLWSSVHPWKGMSLVGALEAYPVNNISTVNEPLSIPVRSDIALYKEQDVSLARLMLDQVVKGPHGVHGRVSAGILELMYAGFDGEVAMPVLGGRFLLGVSGCAVQKRDPEDPFKLKEDDVKDWYTTGFGNARVNVPEYDVWLDVKAGRFLAGDYGARFTVSKFIRGVTLSAWYGVTDTSVFDDSVNEGYEDSGIKVTVPLRLFTGKDSRTAYWVSMSPWTRDVAQDIDHYNNLFDFIGRNTKVGFERDAGEMGE